MARIILATAEGQQAVDLRAVNSLGRHPGNTIQLLDKIVSKEHCIIEQRGNQFVLRDLGSLNGTYINGERVRGEGPLRHGDEIALGATRARFDDGSGAPMPVIRSPSGPEWSSPGAAHGSAVPSAGAAAPYTNPSPVPSGGYAAAGSSAGPMPQGGHGTAPGVPPAAGPYPGYGPQRQGASPLAVSTNSQMDAPTRPSYGQPGARPPSGGYPAAQPVGPGSPAYSAAPPSTPIFPGGQVSPAGQYPVAAGARDVHGTRIDVENSARAIGTQIAAIQKGFVPFEQVAHDGNQLRADYERLRLSHELSREIALERDTTRLLEKILASVFKFIRADRGVIFLRDTKGQLVPGASRRRDGSETPIQVSATILSHVVKERAAVLTHDAALDFLSSAGAKGKSVVLNQISSAIVVPLLHNDEVLGVLWLDSATLAVFQPKDLELVTAVVNQASMFIEINILAKKIEQEIVTRERFSRLLSPNVAERVISGQLEIKKGGELVRECTVFNSDIRGFTRMSEKTDPQLIVDMLNEYFELMVEAVFKFEGTLDKFMGDGIMALWGAPVLHPDDAVRSVQCALEQMRVLGEFNRARMAASLPPVAVGIGIHTGPLVAGYIGSSKALSYTVVGDTANTSARLCGIAEAGQIIVSEPTYNRLGGRFEYEELPPAHVKNKEHALRIFNVKRERPMVAVPAQI